MLADSAEAAVIDLAVTLMRSHGVDTAVPVLADIRNHASAAELVARHRPNVVFHAAGYKHVPLLEAHPVEAAATNVLGTKNMVEAALAAGVERFVSFSTDKAVRPTNVLGQTKAAGEWIVSSWGDEARGQRYSSIRLANVVDATGGILPRFRGQIERGGPLTVTDPRATRLLMTSTEAVGLALVAGAVGDPGGAFWLDVRPAVRILELGRRVASGHQIDIELIGLRPGEKLHEESFSEDGESSPTPCPGVFRTALPRMDSTRLDAWISELADLVGRASDEGVRAALAAPHGLRADELAASAAGAR